MSAKSLEPSGGLKSSPKPGGHPIKVGVSLKIYDIDNAHTVRGWLHVTWPGPKVTQVPVMENYYGHSLRGKWRPDIRVLNSITDTNPLLSDDTEVWIGQDGNVKAVVHLQCQVRMDLSLSGEWMNRQVMQIRLGSLLVPAENMVFEALKEAVDMSNYSGPPLDSSVTEDKFDSTSFTNDGIYSSIIVTLARR